MNRNTHTNTDTGEVIGTTATGQAAEATARQLLDALSRRGRAAAAASVVGARAFEPLEQRQMMSAAAEGVSFADGVLTVRGSHANANDLSVRLSDDGREIWGVANNTAGDHIDVSSVRQIRIYGGEDADAVNVDARIRIPVLVRTGNGFDQITTAAGRDTIVSGNGNDSVNSG